MTFLISKHVREAKGGEIVYIVIGGFTADRGAGFRACGMKKYRFFGSP